MSKLRMCEQFIHIRQASAVSVSLSMGIIAMQDRACQQRLAGLRPMVGQAFPIWIDQHGGDVLRIANLPVPAEADFQQGVEVGARTIVRRRIEFQHLVPSVLLAPAGGKRLVFALDVVADEASRPAEQCWDHEPDALAGSGRCKGEHVFRSIVAQVEGIAGLPVQPPFDVDALRCGSGLGQQFAVHDLLTAGPMHRPVQALNDGQTVALIHRQRSPKEQKQGHPRGKDCHAFLDHWRMWRTPEVDSPRNPNSKAKASREIQ